MSLQPYLKLQLRNKKVTHVHEIDETRFEGESCSVLITDGEIHGVFHVFHSTKVNDILYLDVELVVDDHLHSMPYLWLDWFNRLRFSST